MTLTVYYIAVKSSLHSSDCTVFGLSDEEVSALSKKFGGSHVGVINGVIIKATPMQLLNSLSEIGYKVVCCSAQYNDKTKVKQCLEKTNDANAEDKSGYTALHYASRNGHLEMCKLLISYGANVNALTRTGKASPLHRCATMGHLEIFRLLLQSGASIGLKDIDGKTILHRAVEGNHPDMVEEILKTDPSLAKETDNKGCMPKDYINNSQCLQDILQKYE